jgi:hypothetical protein
MQCPVNTYRSESTGSPMLDAAMLIYGIGAFALFLGYVTVCENL